MQRQSYSVQEIVFFEKIKENSSQIDATVIFKYWLKTHNPAL